MTAAAKPFDLHADLAYHSAQTRCYTSDRGERRHVYGHRLPKNADWCECGEVQRGAAVRAGARKWNGGVLIKTVLEYLCPQPVDFEVPPAHITRVICGVRTDMAAGPTDLAWISSQVAQADPERIVATQAGLLILPRGVTERPMTPSVCLLADDPKLLFTDIVNRYFVDPDHHRVWSVSATAQFGRRVRYGPGVVIGEDVQIGDDVNIGPNTCIAHAVIGNGVKIGANCSIGLSGFGFATDDFGVHHRFPHLGQVVIEHDVEIGSNTCIDRGSLGDTVIRRGAKIDNLVHIAHNCIIGEGAFLIANSTLCGGTVIGAGARVAPSATTREQTSVGSRAIVGLGAVVVRDVDDDTTVIGNPARPYTKGT